MIMICCGRITPAGADVTALVPGHRLTATVQAPSLTAAFRAVQQTGLINVQSYDGGEWAH